MERQKQLEEIAKDVYGAITQCSLNTQGHCNDCEFRGEQNLDCQSWFVAKILTAQNYHKIPEGAVVLTRAEYEELAIDYKRWEKLEIEDMLTQERKETVREIVQEGLKYLYETTDKGAAFASFLGWLEALFGVEVDNGQIDE